MKKIIVIVGPTAVGKTKLSIALAKYFKGEIINADSTQIYKGLNIATAKIKKEEKENVIHHLINIKSLEEDYTVYHYQQDSRKVIKKILNNKKTPIMVGGTGLYIKASLYNYQFKKNLKKNDYSNYSCEELYQMLLKKHPKIKIHPNNRKRIERALDYYEPNYKRGNELKYDALFIGLTVERKQLYERINNRVDQMITQGLIDEARKIYDLKIRSKAVMTPIGYKELFEYFDGDISLDESIELIKQRSRRYAKRQYTWFNNQMDINWFEVNYDNFDKTIDEVIKFIKKRQGS